MYILKWLVQDSSPAFLASPPFDTSTFSSQHKVFEEVCAIPMNSNHVIYENPLLACVPIHSQPEIWSHVVAVDRVNGD